MTIIQKQILSILFSNKGVEFIATDINKVVAFHNGMQLGFYQLPSFAYTAIKRALGNQDATIEQMEVFAYQNFGGFDDVIDICEGGNLSEPEFVSGYSEEYKSQGFNISKAQIRVLKNIPIENKLIADKLCISKNTVERHCQDIYTQFGPNRTQSALTATLKGII